MSQKKTLEKCKKIMQMFEKTKPNTQLKQKSKQHYPRTKKASKKDTKQDIQNIQNNLNLSKQYLTTQKFSTKQFYSRSNSSVNSTKKPYKQPTSTQKCLSKSNLQTCYNRQTRYDKIMKLKIKPQTKSKNPKSKQLHLKASQTSFRSNNSSLDHRSQSKQSRFDKIMKLKVFKPKADSTLKNYQPIKQYKKIYQKQNIDHNSIIQLKKCKQSLKKQQKQIQKQDRLWKVFQRQRQLRLKQKQKKQKNDYHRQRSLQKRFDLMVQKQLKRIQQQKQLGQRRDQGFSTYLFPSY